MDSRNITLGLLAGLLLVMGLACNRSDSSRSSELPLPPRPAPSKEMVARVHLLGERRLGMEAGAYYLMRILTMAQTKRLEEQTVYKLSTAPWRFTTGDAALGNIGGTWLQPLLNNLIQEESYFEIRQPASQRPETVLAIRLNPEQAGHWWTNLSVVVESLSGNHSIFNENGWSVKLPQEPNLFELKRIGDWTLLGLAHERNSLLSEVAGRIRQYKVPYFASETNYWLEADFDPSRVAKLLGLDDGVLTNFERVHVTANGDGANMITHGELTLSHSVALKLDSWTIPTNVIPEALANFTAVRGMQPWIASTKLWKDSKAGLPPDQYYSWTSQGSPLQMYVAAPLPGDGEQLRQLSAVLLEKGNSWLATNGVGNLQAAPDGNGLVWNGLPMASPFLKSVDAGSGKIALAGLVQDPAPASNPAVSGEMYQDIIRRTNLVFYDWELSGPRTESLLYVGQVLRIGTRRPQLPSDSVGVAWLNALMPRLNSSTTLVTLSDTNKLTVIRKSTLGLTGWELHLLTDWLESPGFPRGSYTSSTKP
jgi:hypothetical protein